jgi:hypothetical protein
MMGNVLDLMDFKFKKKRFGWGGKENCIPAKMGSFILWAMAFHAGLPADFE